LLFDPGDLRLTGTQVALEPLRPDHAGALAAAAAESREHYMFNPVPDGAEEAATYIERALRQRASGQRYPFAIGLRGRIVGSTSYFEFQPWEWSVRCGVRQQELPDACEIGSTWLSASAQRTRCNTEAKFLLLRHAFEAWAVRRVRFRTDERNQRSRRAIERLGARLDGILRADMPGRDGTVRNSAYYSLLADEWPALRDRLMSMMESDDRFPHA
jgi:RimJ/RimL family protein N-acetyltransferase